MIVDALQQGNPYSLYDTETFTVNLVKYARYAQNASLLGEIADVLVAAAPYLNTTFGYSEWLCETSACLAWPDYRDQEVRLVSSQFVHLLAEVLYGVASLPDSARGSSLDNFVSTYAYVVWHEHLYKWIALGVDHGTGETYQEILTDELGRGIQLSLRMNREANGTPEYAYVRGGTQPLTANVWHHAVITYNGETAVFYLQPLGGEVSSVKLRTNGQLVADPYELTIGRYISEWNWFNGTLDEVRVYSRILSEDEVARRYKGEEVSSGLAGSWAFDDSDGSSAVQDSSGHGNTGTAFNTQRLSASDCRKGGCLSFDGVSSYVLVAHSQSLNTSSWSGVTLEAWVRPASSSGGGTILCKGWQTGYTGFEMRLTENSVTPVGDTDMWVTSATVYTLAAAEKDASVVYLDDATKQTFKDFVELGRLVVSARFSTSILKDFDGGEVQGVNFDLGASDDTDDYQYSGFTGATPDGLNPADVGVLPQPASNVGWDISHARRFCHFFLAFDECANVLSASFSRAVLVGLTNQVIYGAFNKNFSGPLFTNFMDGTNGW
eukprot:TRINITY_DN2146_c0_g1_i1.p1 TRINITY_DN2146_c0_g1~~TRINITY_DN2146_c0_g1_i1.p1  ORF type:complete len:621 (-),score=145.22 TRINITY_DN2146_c0_g1_i1:1082-2731(-)